ncbi:MAG: YggT family protein, partial [Anaerolineae bacterium]|nr:YggT family protein [Anaerolineae bacterium]
QWAIIIRALLSWIPAGNIDPYHPAMQFLRNITDPILDPIRGFATVGMMDLSPIVAIIGLSLIRMVLLTALGVPTSGGLLF